MIGEELAMLSKAAMFHTAAAAAILCTPAHAQSTDGEAGPTATPAAESTDRDGTSYSDIVVTAQRREQSLLSVPIAITAVTGEALANAGVSDSSQLATVVPNLQINSAYGKTQPNFSLRGIGVGNEYSANQVIADRRLYR